MVAKTERYMAPDAFHYVAVPRSRGPDPTQQGKLILAASISFFQSLHKRVTICECWNAPGMNSTVNLEFLPLAHAEEVSVSVFLTILVGNSQLPGDMLV